VREPRRLARSLQRLGVDRATLRRVADPKRRWVPIARTFLSSDVATIAAMRGVRAEPVGGRTYIPSEGIRRIVGRTNSNGDGLDGIELSLDSVLRGERGTVKALVGARGERYESPEALTTPPRPGHTVTLTISYALQDICDRALADAAARLGATGGDIVMLEPTSGEVRCLATRRPGTSAGGSAALIEPFEPGSTLKPFYTGRLLESGKARADEVIETYNGEYRVHGRTIVDVHKAARMSLADVIRYSSNIGIARFTERFSRREMYEILRDFGFGTATGIAYPSEASGVLRDPLRWSAQSQASLAIGYEMSVTPLQLAAAYAAIANGGLLLTPGLVKSIRDADGNIVYEHRARPVRRVLEARTAAVLRQMLASVVDSGTATDAGLATYTFGGKSGTARRVAQGRYGAGSYTSTFVGLFPAEEPQYVVLVKIDNPRGTYYGGKTAAPVAKAVIEAAIAARDAVLDRQDLALQKARYVPPATTAAPPETVSAAGTVSMAATPAGREADNTRPTRYALVDPAGEPAPPEPVRFDLDEPRSGAAPSREAVTVPDVRGLPLRVAARELHRAGLRVAVVDAATFELSPPPGAVVPRGSIVRVPRR
jgi:cell division protein FtsI (penicillin-binding protein 3)